MKKLGAVIVTNYVYFNPVTTILFAWLILSEPITIYFLLGTQRLVWAAKQALGKAALGALFA